MPSTHKDYQGVRSVRQKNSQFVLSREHLGLDEEQERKLCHFLARMVGTAEDQNIHTRPILAQRLLALCRALKSQPQLRQRCMHDSAAATASCGDRVILALNDLDIAILVDAAQCSADPAQTLEHLGQRLHKLDVVRAAAQRHVNSLAAVDPIEVYLAYEIGLAEALDLPVANPTHAQPRMRPGARG